MFQGPSNGRRLASVMKQMLLEPKYSDLTFQCEGEEIKAHRSIVCQRSTVLDAACRGSFKEANTGSIEVTIADLPTLKRVLSFMYSDDYDDCTESDTANQDNNTVATNSTKADSSVTNSSVTNSFFTHLMTTNSFSTDLIVTDESDNSNSQGYVPRTDDGNEGQAENQRPEPETRSVSSRKVNGVLKNNVKVLIAADYYDIRELINLALEKFHKASKSFHPEGFTEVVCMAYQDVPSHVATTVRQYVRASVLVHAATLFEDKAFMDKVTKIPEFMTELLPQVLHVKEANAALDSGLKTQREKALQDQVDLEKTNAVTQRARAERAENQARVQRQQVYDANECRHCRKDCNVFFKHEGAGRYTLRCTCGTRY